MMAVFFLGVTHVRTLNGTLNLFFAFADLKGSPDKYM